MALIRPLTRALSYEVRRTEYVPRSAGVYRRMGFVPWGTFWSFPVQSVVHRPLHVKQLS